MKRNIGKEKIERIQAIINTFNRQIEGKLAKELEEELELLVSPIPDILYEFRNYSEDSAREAIAVVAGRLISKNTSEAELEPLLKDLSQDRNKWVRIKAQRALTGGKAEAERMSPLGNACMSLFFAQQNGDSRPKLRSLADSVESTFRRKVMRRRKQKRGLIGEDLQATLLFFSMVYGGASTKEWNHDIDDKPGWKGDELRLLSLRRISPMIASFAVWPGRDCRIFLVSVYEHDAYDDFVFWAQNHSTPSEAQRSINKLEIDIDARYLKDASWQKIISWV